MFSQAFKIKNDNPISFFLLAAIGEIEFTNFSEGIYNKATNTVENSTKKKPLIRRRLTTHFAEISNLVPSLIEFEI